MLLTISPSKKIIGFLAIEEVNEAFPVCGPVTHVSDSDPMSISPNLQHLPAAKANAFLRRYI